MKQQIDEFILRVEKERARIDGSDLMAVHQAIETAYEQCIVAHNISKSFFLSNLIVNQEVFDLTVEHLFMPINWSTVKLRTLWAVRNEATGNLLTLERDPDTEVYHLKESSDDPDVLVFAPMLTGSEDDCRMFITMLNELPSDAPVGIGDTTVSLDVDERINLANLEAVLVKLIF